MCADAIEARDEERIRFLVETVYQSMGDRWLWHPGMQLGAEYMVHE